jgi:hypothetical protein
MRTERWFSSSGLFEMLPIYQRFVDHIGSIWFSTGYGDRCSYPRFKRYPGEYVADVTYVNVVRMAEIVRILFLW